MNAHIVVRFTKKDIGKEKPLLVFHSIVSKSFSTDEEIANKFAEELNLEFAEYNCVFKVTEVEEHPESSKSRALKKEPEFTRSSIFSKDN